MDGENLSKEECLKIVADADVSTPEWSPKITWAKCVKVYDGDTIHVVAPVGNSVARFIIRCIGYDCPEIRSRAGKKVSEKEKSLAKLAKEVLQTEILGKMVRLEEVKLEKTWGRVLAKVFSEKDMDIGSMLITEMLAVPYQGRGEKQNWDEWKR